MDAGLIGIAGVRPVAGAGPLVEHAPAPDLVTAETAESERPWVTIVWNDPVNLMSYVTLVFMRDLGHPRPVAEKLMMAVHTEGKASVSTGTREEMEATVARLQVAGLWATLQQD